LWASDGSEGGTRCVADIVPGAAGSAPRELQAIDGVLYFRAADEEGREREWAWNPDAELLEERPAPVVAPAPTLRELLPPDCLELLNLHDEGDWAALGEDVLFAARDPRHGIELWIFEKRSGECRLLADLFTGPPSSIPAHFVTSEGRVCFAAYSLPHGREFWETDGTAEGTRQVRDFLRFPRSGSPTGLIAWHEGVAFLHRNYEDVPIVFYEPTLNKTGEQFLWNFGEALGYPARDLVPAGGHLFFVYRHPAYGEELWCVEAGNSRPRLVKDIAPTVVVQP
jgi:ELWxxDGT repeat protein